MTSVSCRSNIPWSLQIQSHNKTHQIFSLVPNGLRFPGKPKPFLRFSLSDLPGIRVPLVPTIFCSSSDDTAATESDDSPPSIFVKGLPLSTTEGRLRKAFSEFGRVKQVKILTDRETGESLGLAYIWMNRPEYAELAVTQMNGTFFDGRFINLTIPKRSRKREKKEKKFKF